MLRKKKCGFVEFALTKFTNQRIVYIEGFRRLSSRMRDGNGTSPANISLDRRSGPSGCTAAITLRYGALRRSGSHRGTRKMGISVIFDRIGETRGRTPPQNCNRLQYTAIWMAARGAGSTPGFPKTATYCSFHGVPARLSRTTGILGRSCSMVANPSHGHSCACWSHVPPSTRRAMPVM